MTGAVVKIFLVYTLPELFSVVRNLSGWVAVL
jgi:hypothetical protein